jgi:hypothetical protein
MYWLSLSFRPLQKDEGVLTRCHRSVFMVGLEQEKPHTAPSPVYSNHTYVKDDVQACD